MQTKFQPLLVLPFDVFIVVVVVHVFGKRENEKKEGGVMVLGVGR